VEIFDFLRSFVFKRVKKRGLKKPSKIPKHKSKNKYYYGVFTI